MLALIKKDFLHFGLINFPMFILLIIFIAIVGPPATIIMMIGLTSTVITAFSGDEKNKSIISLASMPVKKQSIVIGRYMYGFVMLVLLLGLIWIATAVSNLPELSHYHAADFLIFFCIGLVLLAFIFPVMYHLGSSLAGFAAIFLFVFMMLLMIQTPLINMLGMTDIITYNRIDKGFTLLAEKYIPWTPFFGSTILSAIMFYASLRLSVFLFKRKDLS